MQINKGRLTLETTMWHVCLCGKVRVRGRASKVRKPAKCGRWKGSNKYRHLVEFPRIDQPCHPSPVTCSNCIITDVTTILQDPVSKPCPSHQCCHFLIFSVSWTDTGHVLSPAITPFDTCVVTVPEILQLSYKKWPLGQRTLWSEKAQSPVEKAHPVISGVNVYVPVSKTMVIFPRDVAWKNSNPPKALGHIP